MNDKKTKALSVLLTVLVALMLGVFPLYFQNKYINIIQAKRSFFEVIGWSTIVILLTIILAFEMESTIASDVGKSLTSGHKISICLLASGLFLSTGVSDNVLNSVFAPDGRRYGLTVVVLSILLFIFLATYYKNTVIIIWIIVVTNSIMSILIIADNWKIDLLGMKDNLIEAQHSKFTGTMGNINVNASYLAIIIPLLIGLFYSADVLKLGKILQLFLMSGIALTCSAGLCVRSDSIIWCIFLVLYIVMYYTMVYCNTFKAYLRMTAIIFSVGIAYTVIGVAYYSNPTASYKFSGVGEYVCQGKGLLGIWVICILSVVLTILKLLFEKMNLKSIARIVLVITVAVIVFFAIMLVVANIIAPETHNSFIRRFYMDNSFGNNRGYVWRNTIQMIISNGFLDFICGHGLNRFYVPFYEYCYSDMMSKFSAPFIDAHNEALQMLVTTGIFGMTGYIGMFISSVYDGVKKAYKSPVFVIEILVMGSYLLQGVVNNPQVFTLPLIFIVMGILSSISGE